MQEKNLGVSEEGLVVSSQKEENGSSARKCLKWNEENKNAREIDQEKCATARMAINASWYIQDLESPLGLIEELFCDDPWRLLISTIFLNRTSRVQVDVVLHTFLRNWPTATAASRASQDAIAEIVGPLGLRYKRASGIIRFSKEYLSLLEKKTKEGNGTEMDKLDVARALSEKDILGLYFCGDYAYAAYKLFIVRDSRTDHEDHALHAYVDYQRAKLSHNDNSKALVGTM
mgnify:CR=1 FL=1